MTITLDKKNTFLIIILGISFILRIYGLNYQSPWVDELFTLKIATYNNSFESIYNTIKTVDQHPPLYYFSIHTLFKIFGDSIVVARLFSVFLGVLGIFYIYKLSEELVSSDFARIPTVLIAVNYFHILHSQEARMYSLVFLTSVISFYYLIKFFKNPSMQMGVKYGFAAALLLNSHILCLFLFLTQCLITLIYFIKSSVGLRKSIIKYLSVSYLIIFIFYLPTLIIVFNLTSTESFWIKKPTVSILKDMIEEFLGSRNLLFLYIGLTILGLYQLFIKNRHNIRQINIGLILLLWFFVPFIIALIVSFVRLPIIVPRYFFGLFPSIVLCVAYGIYKINNNVLKYSILLLTLFFSLQALFDSKDYYNRISKTQFREAGELINDYSRSSLVVSRMANYIDYFLDEDRYTVKENTLSDYVKDLEQTRKEIKEFWYFDGHNPLEVDSLIENNNYIQNNYLIDVYERLFDSYVIHFIMPDRLFQKLDIDSEHILRDLGEKQINNIEYFQYKNDILSMRGWAFIDDKGMKNSKIYLLLIKDGKLNQILLTNPESRADVSNFFKSTKDLSLSGFNINKNISNLDKGTYSVRLFIVKDDFYSISDDLNITLIM